MGWRACKAEIGGSPVDGAKAKFGADGTRLIRVELPLATKPLIDGEMAIDGHVVRIVRVERAGDRWSIEPGHAVISAAPATAEIKDETALSQQQEEEDDRDSIEG